MIKIVKIGIKTVYNIDGMETASDWAKKEIKGLKTYDKVNLSSAIKITEKNTRGTIFDDALGFINNGGNNIDQNIQMCALFTTSYGNGNGHGLNNTNFTKCTALFSARKLIMPDWTNSKDEYMKPNTDI